MFGWYIWTISKNRFQKVKEYLLSNGLVEEILYPLVDKKYKTAKGDKRRKVPLYENYIFVKYDRTTRADVEIKKCVWIYDNIGSCTDAEIDKMRNMNNTRYEEIVAQESIHPGDTVRLRNESFKDMTGVVTDVVQDKILVKVLFFGEERVVKCCQDDILTK